jgi:hypothetical protein
LHVKPAGDSGGGPREASLVWHPGVAGDNDDDDDDAFDGKKWWLKARDSKDNAGVRDIGFEYGEWKPLTFLPGGGMEEDATPAPRVEVHGDLVLCDKDGNRCEHLNTTA